MRIKEKSQLKDGGYYYYAEYHSPNFDGQTEGVGVYRAQYGDWAEKRRKDYGYAEKDEWAFKSDRVEFVAGKHPDLMRSETYWKTEWLYGNHKRFYDDIVEAEREAIQMTFAEWHPWNRN